MFNLNVWRWKYKDMCHVIKRKKLKESEGKWKCYMTDCMHDVSEGLPFVYAAMLMWSCLSPAR